MTRKGTPCWGQGAPSPADGEGAGLGDIARPFIFVRYLDFGAIGAICNMHAWIT